MRTFTAAFLLALILTACGGEEKKAAAPSPAPATQTAPKDVSAETPPPTGEAETAAPDLELPDTYAALLKPRFVDLDQLAKQRAIRVLVVQSRLFYFVDQGQQRGLTYESLQQFEQFINKRLRTKTLKVHVVPIPVARDELITALEAGHGDIAVAGLTINAEREQHVDFSNPVADDATEVVVAGPSAPPVKGIWDLSGKSVWVRRSSNYYRSLEGLNRTLRGAGRPLIDIKAADEHLEDEDLIEMVAAGVLPLTVVDDYAANLWSQVFDKAQVRSDLVVRVGNRLAWAVRKKSPQLLAAVNDFVKTHRTGTRMGNILLFKYLKETDWVKDALARDEVAKLQPMITTFRKYSEEYDFDWLMIAAQAYQESGLDQNKKSHVGAIGVMQVMPTTAKDKRIAVPGIDKLEPNIHAGTKYLRLMQDDYFNEPGISELNRMLFSFAAYNAGPARIQGLRREARKQGLDPNQWFQNVEVLAARRIGRETVQYVSNIYKYYLAYQLIGQQLQAKEEARQNTTTP